MILIMELYISAKIRNSILFLILSGVFLFLVFFGVSSGKKQAQSILVLNQVSEEILALNYFYDDNNRYPTGDEFARSEVMQNYLTKIPKSSDIQNSFCPETLKYLRPRPESYELSFCLPKAQDGYKLGWNKIIK